MRALYVYIRNKIINRVSGRNWTMIILKKINIGSLSQMYWQMISMILKTENHHSVHLTEAFEWFSVFNEIFSTPDDVIEQLLHNSWDFYRLCHHYIYHHNQNLFGMNFHPTPLYSPELSLLQMPCSPTHYQCKRC